MKNNSKTPRFEAPIPKTPKNKHRKRCYTIWQILWRGENGKGPRAGGKIVWLTDKQKTFYLVKYPNKFFEEVLERDRLEAYKKYLDQTVD